MDRGRRPLLRKIFEIRKGKKCSLHCRKIKTKPFMATTASGWCELRSRRSATIEEFKLVAGECVDVPIGLSHQMEALEDAELFEFSTRHFDSDRIG